MKLLYILLLKAFIFQGKLSPPLGTMAHCDQILVQFGKWGSIFFYIECMWMHGIIPIGRYASANCTLFLRLNCTGLYHPMRLAIRKMHKAWHMHLLWNSSVKFEIFKLIVQFYSNLLNFYVSNVTMVTIRFSIAMRAYSEALDDYFVTLHIFRKRSLWYSSSTSND